MMQRLVIASAAFITLGAVILGVRPDRQNLEALSVKARAYISEHRVEILKEYFEFLRIPNVASDESNIRRNAEFLLKALQNRGVEARLLEVKGAPPVVFGEIPSATAKETVAFYAHYDGQPVDRSGWRTDPWDPVLADRTWEGGGRELRLDSLPEGADREWRMYARSSSDDKAPIMAILSALDVLESSGLRPAAHLKFLFEGEEEAGSPRLPEILDTYGSVLDADAWILCDGPVHQSGRNLVYFGARGILGLEMTLYGPRRPLHSGHYGNWAPNPSVLASHLISGLRDTDGHVLIPGFYDDVRPLSSGEKKALSEIPRVDEDVLRELGLAWSEGPEESLVERIMHPAVNIRGILAGNVEAKARNAIPTEAKISIDIRLVPDQDPSLIRAGVESHLRKQGYFIVPAPPDQETRLTNPRIVKLEWETGYPSARTDMNLPFCRSFIQIMERTLGESLIRMPSAGGSIPLYLFKTAERTPVILLPVVNYDNNQHGANENLRLENLWRAIELFAGLFHSL
jgi:acetylornithine deacetylase/succinyl-diaminopimelate desuccinylase-like protein